MLFPDVERKYKGPHLQAEPAYSFLQRSSRPAAAAVRELLENWIARAPDDERPRLCRHMRSGDDDRFRAAFFELYTRELLAGLDYSMQWHPDLGHPQGRSPDFLAAHVSAPSLIVEATTASDMSPGEVSSAPGMRRVYDAINALNIREFWIDIAERGRPKKTPSAKHISSDLARWIGGLDYSEIKGPYDDGRLEELPVLEKTYDGWTLRFTAIPKPAEALDDPDRAVILLHSFGVRASNTKQALKRAVKRKATRYDEISNPYVIAVNIEAWDVDEDDIFEAFISSRPYVWNPREPVESGHYELAHDGVWLGPNGPCNTRVSAVLVASGLTPWTAADRDVQLVLNPWPRAELTGPLRSLTRRVPAGDHWDFKEGVHPRQVLGLSEGWPG